MTATNEELEIAFHHLELEMLDFKAECAKVMSELITAWKKTGLNKGYIN